MDYDGVLVGEIDEFAIQPMISFDTRVDQIIGGRLSQPHPELNTLNDVLNVLRRLGPLSDQPKSCIVVAAGAVGERLDLCPIVLQASPPKGEGSTVFWELVEAFIGMAIRARIRQKFVSISMDGDLRMRMNIHNIMRIANLNPSFQYVFLDHPDSRYAAPIFPNYGPICFNPDPEHLLKNVRNSLKRFMILGPFSVSMNQLEEVRKRVPGLSDKGTRHNLGRNDINHLVSVKLSFYHLRCVMWGWAEICMLLPAFTQQYYYPALFLFCFAGQAEGRTSIEDTVRRST